MASVELENVQKAYGTVDVIRGVDLAIEEGEFIAFVGPSGCGKSTLLRIIAGLEEVKAGRISIGGRDVTYAEPSNRGVAMVFQSYALYPHMTVRENMSFGLRMTGTPKQEIERRVSTAAEVLQLGTLLERRPRALSGGQRQRVAIGRAIVRDPKVFLFDEPLSNLDAELRVQMRVEIARLHQHIKATMIYVTHDQVEAMTLADRIVVLDGGRIVQFGRPLDLYDDPDNLFVAGFIGSPKMNFLAGRILHREANMMEVFLEARGGKVTLDLGPAANAAPGDKVTLGIRPEHFMIMPAGEGHFDARADVAEQLGNATYIHLNAAQGEQLVVGRHGDRSFTEGETLGLRLPAERTFLFDAAGQRIR